MSDERVLERARAAWREAIDRDDAIAGVDRQRRIAWRLQAGSVRAPASVALVRYAVVASLGLVAAAGWAGRGSGGWLRKPTVPSAPPASTAAESPARRAPAAKTQGGAAADESPWIVATAPCFDCSRAGSDAPSIAPGERLVPGERARVPLGSTLVLGRGGDAAWRLEVPGPAAVVVTSRGEVESTPGLAEPPAPPESVRGAAAAPAVVAPANADPTGRDWSGAEAALRDGDRAGAERILRRVVEVATPSSKEWERATFLLAELELARGAKVAARTRLERLRVSGDDALVADAVFLEGRASEGPRERVVLYERYLATHPPSPYRERALVDEARGLLDIGDVKQARARVAALRSGAPLPAVAAAALAPLERDLTAREAETPGTESAGAAP